MYARNKRKQSVECGMRDLHRHLDESVTLEDAVALIDELAADDDLIVWWASRVECVSAIARLERDGALTANETAVAIDRLSQLATAWHEVAPGQRLRDIATRLLRVHPLRAADALQLAAAIVGAEQEPTTLEFLTLDERLATAAAREGFRVRGA